MSYAMSLRNCQHAVNNAIQALRDSQHWSDVTELIPLFEQMHDVKLTFDVPGVTIEFLDQDAHLMFMLRWS